MTFRGFSLHRWQGIGVIVGWSMDFLFPKDFNPSNSGSSKVPSVTTHCFNTPTASFDSLLVLHSVPFLDKNIQEEVICSSPELQSRKPLGHYFQLVYKNYHRKTIHALLGSKLIIASTYTFFDKFFVLFSIILNRTQRYAPLSHIETLLEIREPLNLWEGVY